MLLGAVGAKIGGGAIGGARGSSRSVLDAGKNHPKGLSLVYGPGPRGGGKKRKVGRKLPNGYSYKKHNGQKGEKSRGKKDPVPEGAKNQMGVDRGVREEGKKVKTRERSYFQGEKKKPTNLC